MNIFSLGRRLNLKFISQAARKVTHPMVIIILTWCAVSTWGAPFTSISLMLGVILARVDTVSLKTIYFLYAL